jgi:3-oxoacyl-[acyl-carrier protein] reductase
MSESPSRVAVVTGVSRRNGIGFAIAQRLLSDGFRVLLHSWAAHDYDQPWAPGEGELEQVIQALGGISDRLAHIEADFARPDAPARVIEHAIKRFGVLDVLIANHAMSATGDLAAVSARQLDLAFAVNARATALLVQAFAARHDDQRPDGRVLLFTSGQHRGPMADELAYAISKGAVQQMTASLADALAHRSITVNALNPGPVDTGCRAISCVSAFARRFQPAAGLGTTKRYRRDRELHRINRLRLDHRPDDRRRRRLSKLTIAIDLTAVAL